MRDLLSWILITTLMVSPLMAQNPPAQNFNINNTTGHYDNTLVGTSILMALPPRAAAAAMPPTPSNGEAGKNHSIIIGILILAGAATAVYLLWPNGKHDAPVPVAAPVTPVPTGTILQAGTPSVKSPNQ